MFKETEVKQEKEMKEIEKSLTTVPTKLEGAEVQLNIQQNQTNLQYSPPLLQNSNVSGSVEKKETN